MNTKSLSVALAIAAGSAFAPMVASAASIVTLDTVQVRPSADQLAQQAHERTSAIPTLDAIQVRPTAGQIAERELAALAATRVVTLDVVQVRPSVEQRQTLAAERGVAALQAASEDAAANLATLLGQTIVSLPLPKLQPAPSDLEALLGSIGNFAARY